MAPVALCEIGVFLMVIILEFRYPYTRCFLMIHVTYGWDPFETRFTKVSYSNYCDTESIEPSKQAHVPLLVFLLEL